MFGRDYAQHGFSDMAQVDVLLEALALRLGERVLELGCGNGGIAEYIAEASGAHVIGLDFIPEAIRQAQVRALAQPERLAFVVGDIGALGFAAASFDAVIAIDTLYFTELTSTLAVLARLLKPGGRMALFYQYGVDPEHPIETFDRSTMPAERTPLGAALAGLGLPYTARDFSEADYAHARHKKRVLEEVRAQLAGEGATFLFDNRYGEACGVLAAYEAGCQARYLYVVRKPVL